MFTLIKNYIERKQNERLAEDLKQAIRMKRYENMQVTMIVLKNYLSRDMLVRTGLLYSPDDTYIETKAQSLFWEWKDEGLINEFDDFEETTKSWIMAFA